MLKKVLLFCLPFIFVGCALKDADTCDMKHSKIILNLNLDEKLTQNLVLINNLNSINPDFVFENNRTNIINTNFYEATKFYNDYSKLVSTEMNYIKNQVSPIDFKLNNEVHINSNECPLKTLYINGIHTETKNEVEYIISLHN